MTLMKTQSPAETVEGGPDSGESAGHTPDRALIRHRIESLTPRERQVLELLVNGLRGKEICARLGISLRTVEVHRASVLRKMRAGSLAQLGWQVAVCGVTGDGPRIDSGNNWEDRHT